MPKILLVDDDEQLANLLKQTLSAKRYLVEVATNSEMGWHLVQAAQHDVIVLDVMLPKQNGIEFCQRLRSERIFTPVLMLTARGNDIDKIKGLEAGADDYLTKPFNLDELLARIRVLLRRGSTPIPDCLTWGELKLDQNRGQVTYRDQIIPLRTKEYLLLELFLRHKTRIFSQQALIDLLWDLEEIPTENAVRTHIKGLRQKLKQAGAEDLIETVYGLGYRLRHAEPNAESSATKSDSPNAHQLIQPTVIPSNIHPSDVRPTDLSVGSQSSSRSSKAEAEFLSEFRQAWKRYRSSYFDRLQIVEAAGTVLLSGQLTESQHQQVVKELHTLKGSLGSFGLAEACKLAAALEQTCQSYDDFTAQTFQQQQAWVQQLQNLRQAMQMFDLEPAIESPSADSLSKAIHRSQSRLLIVEDDACLGAELAKIAANRGMQVEVVQDLAAARSILNQISPDAILLDLNLSESNPNGLALLEEVATRHRIIPTVVFTAHQGLLERLQAMRGGAQFFLQKPLPPERVIDIVLQATQRSTHANMKLLLVADESSLLSNLHQILEPWGFQTISLHQPQQFWRVLEQTQPHLLILKAEMTEISGYDLCRIVRNDPNWQHLPILLLVDRTDQPTMHRVFLAGGDTFLPLSLVTTELVLCVFSRLERSPIPR